MLENETVVAELADLRASGVQIGVTASGTSQPETIESAIGLGMFDALQATWNLHERAAERALAAAHDAGIRVIVKEALANGRLSPRGRNGALDAVAARRGTTSDAIALAAALARPWADTVLLGAASVDTLASNLAAQDVRWSGELERELSGLAEPSAAYWQTRSRLRWN